MRALKEIDFGFSVKYRTALYQHLVRATEEKAVTLEFAKYFVLQLSSISHELSGLILQFNQWKNSL
ncbi:MAG: hypothetical protein AAFR62_15205 [Cyanobacteria bacterium J06629_2]